MILALACRSSPTAPSSASALPPSASVPPSTQTLPSCATWANEQRAGGLPEATGARATYRAALYAAGGGVRVVNATSYAMWFPSGWAPSTSRVIFGLHGTEGNAEEDWWFNWKGSVGERGYAYVGLSYLSASGQYDDEPAAYANIKAVMADIAASCHFGAPAVYLVGFSRGSAMTYGLAYLDLKERRFFSSFGHNSGAWPIGAAMTPTMSGFVTRGETGAYASGRFWMYCGERDISSTGPMCEQMASARTFVTSHGGSAAELFRDPTGGHGGLNGNPAAQASMYAYFESSR